MKRTGIKDIAKRARVSLAAVSRFLNDENFSIRDATKQRILKAVADLNYVPDHAARSLKRGKKETIGVILSHIDAHMTALLAEIEICLSREKHTLLLASSEQDVSREISLVNTMRQRCDALLIVSQYSGSIIAAKRYRDVMSAVPVVFIDSLPPSTAGMHFVAGDNAGDAKRAAAYFVSRGVRDFCYLGSGRKLAVLKDRFRGFQEAVGDAPLHSFSTADGAALIAQVTKAKHSPLVFFESLFHFEALLPAFAKASLVIGRDVFITGFDEPLISNPLAVMHEYKAVITEPIPFILQNRTEMARVAVDAVLRNTAVRSYIPGTLMNFAH